MKMKLQWRLNRGWHGKKWRRLARRNQHLKAVMWRWRSAVEAAP
jgi:hypothetical protein